MEKWPILLCRPWPKSAHLKTLDYITHSSLSLSSLYLTLPQPHNSLSPSLSLSRMRRSSAGAWHLWRCGGSDGEAGPRTRMDVGHGTLGGGASSQISPTTTQRCSARPTAARLHRLPPAAVWVLGFIRQWRGGAPLHHRHPQVWRPLPPQRAPAPAVALACGAVHRPHPFLLGAVLTVCWYFLAMQPIIRKRMEVPL